MRVFNSNRGSGCVGHYLVHFSVLRNPAPNRSSVADSGQAETARRRRRAVTILKGDLRDGAAHARGRCGGCRRRPFLAATAWGGKDTFDITVGANLAPRGRADSRPGCRRGSIRLRQRASTATSGFLERRGPPSTAPSYIRAKHRLVDGDRDAGQCRAHHRHLSPTIIFGGGAEPVGAPLSHAARMLFENRRWPSGHPSPRRSPAGCT